MDVQILNKGGQVGMGVAGVGRTIHLRHGAERGRGSGAIQTRATRRRRTRSAQLRRGKRCGVWWRKANVFADLPPHLCLCLTCLSPISLCCVASICLLLVFLQLKKIARAAGVETTTNLGFTGSRKYEDYGKDGRQKDIRLFLSKVCNAFG